jgi:hypothetical protein
MPKGQDFPFDQAIPSQHRGNISGSNNKLTSPKFGKATS